MGARPRRDARRRDPRRARAPSAPAATSASCTARAGAGDHAAQLAFWREEYQLNSRIKRYPKPIVALVDGIVMGGGVGVSVHATHRVAGDRFVFAMPEVGIGFFPDVGATFFCHGCPAGSARYLALTGARVRTADAVALGIATAYVPSERMAGARRGPCGPGGWTRRSRD